MRKPGIKKILPWAVLLLFNIAIAGSLSIPLIQFTRNRNQLLIQHRREIENQISTTLALYDKMSESLFQLSVNTPEVRSLLRTAYSAAGREEKNRIRIELMNLLGPFYRTIQTYGFRQLHFHEPDNVSFLRFHRPETYGDDLTGIRYSVDYVNRYHQPIRGFEEGRIFNGYRFVYPLFGDSEVLGSVEVSVSMKTLVDQLESYYGTKALFLLSRSTVEKKVFDHEWENYLPWEIDGRFVLDREVNDCCFLNNPEDVKVQEIIRKGIEGPMDSGQSFSLTIRSGEVRKIATFLPVRNIEGELVAWLFTLSDFLPLKQLYRRTTLFVLLILTIFSLFFAFSCYFLKSREKLESLASKDSLTGVYTRRMLFQLLQQEEEQFKRYGHTYSLIMIDIDHFKRINDDYGHQMGDELLISLTGILVNNIRKSDIIGRYGGEEFLILLPHIDLKEARVVGEKLRRAVEEYPFSTGRPVTISGGISQRQAGGEDFTGLIRLADERLYEAKREGRNRIVPGEGEIDREN